MTMDIQAALWRDLAEQAVAVALRLRDPGLRLEMLSIASGYEAMAKHAEQGRWSAKADPMTTQSHSERPATGELP